MYSIYRVKNNLNDKSYIGIAIQPDRRFLEHKSRAKNGSPYHLHRAMRKDGTENFSFDILASGEDYRVGLKIVEPLFIEMFKPEYNMTKGGDGVLGLVHSEKTKKLWSERRKGRIPWNKGLQTGPLSPEVCEKMGNSRRGKTFSMEARKAMSNGRKGIQFSEEHKKNIGKSAEGRIPWNKGKMGMQIPWNKGLKIK